MTSRGGTAIEPSLSDPQSDSRVESRRPRRLWAGLFLVAWASQPFIGSHAAEPAPDFERTIAPILNNQCLECHNRTEKAGGLDLTTRAGLMKGGDAGASVVPGNVDESFLIQRVVDGEMPPKKQGKPRPLPAAEVDKLRSWVAAGAAWPEGRTLDPFEVTSLARGGRDWWSLQPIAHPQIPSVKQPERVANPIDAFIAAGLEEKGWALAPEADRRTLIRRVSYDLTGLPPTFEDVEAFAADKSPGAYERLIDRLLASPHYGERWARYWLDVARFAETSGYERDQVKPKAWKYRDWVIQAFNEDKPFDQFVHEQVAGDELPNKSESTVVATGFLRLGTWNDEPNDPQEYKYERLEDMVHATSTAFLAMTVKCARCHDHKFDPIRQTDYYRMASTFWAGFIEPGDRELLGGPDRKTLGYDVFGWTDKGREPPPLHLLKKGDPNRPSEVVEPGHLSMVPLLDQPFKAPAVDAKTSQRRLQLAQWITDPRNPLTARVWVNRLWQHHFGQGLVRSPDNFGFTGDKATHPELLDWLANALIEGGWKSKPLHKMMLLSSAYRQASLHPKQEQYARIDAGNRLWWHAERRRLEAETMRDSLLFASGSLDTGRMGGPSFYPEIAADALEGLSTKSDAWKPSPLDEQRRRGIYVFSKRGLLPPLMTAFDMPDTTLPCGQRDVTLVAPQALALLNNSFVHQQSMALAKSIVVESGDQPGQIRAAWRRVLGREPKAKELAVALAHLEKQRAYFQQRAAKAVQEFADRLPMTQGLTLHLSADQGVTLDDTGAVESWEDTSGRGHHALQTNPNSRPRLTHGNKLGKPVVRFNGQNTFFGLTSQVLTSQQFSMYAVASDQGSGPHRTLFSNWNGSAGNSTSSIFFGTTNSDTIRLSDDFSANGDLHADASLFVMSAVAGESSVAVYRNAAEVAQKQVPLATRLLTTPYVIGQQGNIQGEYWNGDLAELIVFDRALSAPEHQAVTRYLMARYGIEQPPANNSGEMALASLCHVLLNSNEFLYVD
ncbi:DUF1549 domain-containing protein [Singulisphaera sp. PoT]|uniref:DUF1549 domain-containing protein n=1 Tax=Singulisphaera sp. PoT TaxID=3411797 RepID=UPI003BF4A5BE